MQENIVAVVEKENEFGELKTDSVRLTKIGWGIAQTLRIKCGGSNDQHVNLIIEVKKLSEAINMMPDGTCRTIKSQYQNNTVQNFESQGSFGATGVVNVETLGNYMPSEHNASRVVDTDGISPTVMENHGTVTGVVDVKTVDAVIGSMQENAMVGNGDYSPSLTSAMGMGGGQTPMVVEKTCVAMRGRNPENPSDRTTGCPTEQRLEPNTTACTNTLTTVQKDNLVLEETVIAYDEQNQTVREETFGTLTTDGSSPKHNNRVIKIKQATKQGFIECEVGGVCCLDYPTSELRRGRVIENGQVSPTLTTENIPSRIEFGNPDFYNFLYEIEGEIYLIRIRKLIPKECWRLMGFTDEDFEKAQKVNSNTQLYKQAGNSIVVNCLEAIMSQMNIQGIPKWNDINK